MELKCNLKTCRYNINGKCTNKDKREICIDVSKKVLCLNKKQNKNLFNICETNINCENVENCDYAIDITTFKDIAKGITRYINGRKKCPYRQNLY